MYGVTPKQTTLNISILSYNSTYFSVNTYKRRTSACAYADRFAYENAAQGTRTDSTNGQKRVSTQRITSYINRWACWWVRTSEKWQYTELLEWFIAACWDGVCASYPCGLIYQYKLKDGRTEWDSPRATLTAV